MRAGLVAAAPTAGSLIAEVLPAKTFLSEGGVTGWPIALLVLIVAVGLPVFRDGGQARDIPPTTRAVGLLVGAPALRGLLLAGLIASASGEVLLGLFQSIVTQGGVRPGMLPLGDIISLAALVGGGLLTDGFARGNRGYALWVVAALGLTGLVLLVQAFGVLPFGTAIVTARLTAGASLGAFLALVVRAADPAARRMALMFFAALRLIGAVLLAPALYRHLGGNDLATVLISAAAGMILAAAIVAVTQPDVRRRF